MTEENKLIGRLREICLKGSTWTLKAAPLFMEAIGVGAFLSCILEKNPGLKKRLGELDGKVFLFEAKDIKKKFFLHIKGGDIKVALHVARSPDVIMSGDVKVLFDVFTGKADPDTVFFSRKLEIQGETASAIHLKNILAALS
ncbi:MAG: SCP2 domain-containing protein [Thermodesulfobacteriota bacterium]